MKDKSLPAMSWFFEAQHCLIDNRYDNKESHN
jgi:hypothetical protein